MTVLLRRFKIKKITSSSDRGRQYLVGGRAENTVCGGAAVVPVHAPNASGGAVLPGAAVCQGAAGVGGGSGWVNLIFL